MKNFTRITFVFSILSFALGLLTPQFSFLGIGLALVIILVSLIEYTGVLKGISLFLIFTILPGVIESYGFQWNISFFQAPVIQNITHANWRFALDPQIAGTVMVISILFIASIFFAHHFSLYFKSIRYEKTRLILVASILLAFTFVNTVGGINVLTIGRWLVIAIILFVSTAKLFTFKPMTDKLYKILPIVFYYGLPLYIAVSVKNYSMFLIMAIVGTVHLFFYLLRPARFGRGHTFVTKSQ